jgi:hypothetical protein
LSQLTPALALAIALALPGCSWLKSSSKEPPPVAKSKQAEEEEEIPPATAGQIGSLASNLLGATRKKIQAARVEQLTKDDPDYSFCRGVRCPPRTPKQVVYSNEPEMQLKGITQRGEASPTVIARAAPAAVERRSLTAAAYAPDGSLVKAAQEQIAGLGRKHASSKFQVIYIVLPNSTPQDELKATKRGVELERALIAGGVTKARIELRAERAESMAGGRVAEVLVLPTQ